jgi:hypothetical protein
MSEIQQLQAMLSIETSVEIGTEDTDARYQECLPIGWFKFINDIQYACRHMNVKLVTLKIFNGVLYITGTTWNGPTQALFDRIARTFTSDSARTCMICGNAGSRRKDLEHKPALCMKHFLDYINV